MTTNAEILAQRARDLARPATPSEPGDQVPLVEFRIGPERYALEARQVLAAFTLGEYSPLPGMPPSMVGVTIWRGSLLLLLDLRIALGVSRGALNDLRSVLVLRRGSDCLGILVDELAALGTRPLSDFATDESHARPVVRGRSGDAVTLLDAELLLDPHHIGDDIA